MAAHPVSDPILSHTNTCDVSIDTVHSAEDLAGSHIVDQLPEYILRRPDLMKLLTIDAYVPPGSNEYNRMYQFMNNYNKWDELPNTADVNDMGSSHTFTVDNTSDYSNESIDSDCLIGKRQS